MLKVIDFGIAKATSGGLGDHDMATESRHLLGTPDYMSPEQADLEAADIDTRADVYSLGVVLYEILCGSTPLDQTRLRSGSFAEMQRMIREDEPPRPSARAAAEMDQNDVALRRSTNPKRLASRLRGDLDWITLKALQKDRNRRYPTPAELAEDIRRHLDHQPVLAAPPGLGYPLRKFARRHRVAMLAGGLIVLALLGGTIGTTIGLVRARDASQLARHAAEEANSVNEFMREFLTSADPDEDGANVALADVLDEASEAASRRFTTQPEVEARVRILLGQVYLRLGLLQQAESELRRSAKLWTVEAGPDDPRTLQAMIGVGLALVNQERPSEALQYLGDFLPRVDRVFDLRDERRWQGHALVADAFTRRSLVAEGERILRHAIAQATTAGADESSLVRLINSLTLTLRQKIARADEADRGAAIEAFRASAAELLERASRIGKPGRWFVRNARGNLADVALLERNYADAAEQARALLEESAGILDDCQVIRTVAMRVLAQALNQMGEIQEPADLYCRLIECVRSRQVGNGDNILALSHMCDALPILDRAGRWSDGERYAREAIAMLSTMGGHIGVTSYEAHVAHFMSAQGKLVEAQIVFDALLEQPDSSLSQSDRLRLSVAYSSHLLRQGRLEEVEHRLQELAAEIDIRAGLAVDFPEEIPALFVELYRTWGKTTQAEEYERIRRDIIARVASGDS